MNDHKSKGKGIFGTTEAYGGAIEEQGRAKLHIHFLIWVLSLQQLLHKLFNNDGSVNEEMRNKLTTYIKTIMSASYEVFEQEEEVKHEEVLTKEDNKDEKSSDKKNHICNGVLKEVEDQVMRDKRNKSTDLQLLLTLHYMYEFLYLMMFYFFVFFCNNCFMLNFLTFCKYFI